MKTRQAETGRGGGEDIPVPPAAARLGRLICRCHFAAGCVTACLSTAAALWAGYEHSAAGFAVATAIGAAAAAAVFTSWLRGRLRWRRERAAMAAEVPLEDRPGWPEDYIPDVGRGEG